LTLFTPCDVSVIAHRDFIRVVPAGEIDLWSCRPLREQIDELWASGWTDVVLDLRAVTFMDSSGLHLLIDNHKRAVAAAMRFSLIDGGGPVARILDISGLRDMLVFAPPDRLR
jgi:anti-sigma B factor antagonist